MRGVWGTYREQLDVLHARYSDRRTVANQLLEEVVQLVDLIATDERSRHEAQLAEAERQHSIQLARVEDRLARATDDVQRLERARTNLRETRETIDDGVLVKILAPRAATWEGKESNIPRPWTLGELETLMYRMRLGGGTDHTEVRFKHDHTEATIPFPELVLEAPTPKTPDPPERPAVRWRNTRSAFAITGAVALVVLVYGALAIAGVL